MSDPDQMIFRRGGGLVATLFGLPFLVGGLFVILSAGPSAPWHRFVFGGVMALFGLVVACGRSGAVVDRARGEVTCWWGLLFPIIRTRHEVGAFSYAGIERQVVKSGNSVRSLYSTSLRPSVEGAEGIVELHTEKTKPGAKDQAEKLARFLQLEGVVDATGTTPVVC